MTDKHDDEYGFDSEDMEALKKVDDKPESVVGSDEPEPELDIDMDAHVEEAQEKGDTSSMDDYFERIGVEGREKIKYEVESGGEGDSAKKKTSTGLVLGVSAVVVTLIVGVGGYFLAPLVLGGAAPQQANTSFYSAPESFQSDTDGDLVGGDFSGDVGGDGDAFAFSSDAGVEDDLGEDFDFGAEGDNENAFGIPAGSNLSSSRDGRAVEAHSRNEVHDDIARQTRELAQEDEFALEEESDWMSDSDDDVVIRPQVSDEERMYDNILAEAAAIDAPHTAIKIDRNVVSMELQVKRLDRVEHDIAETRSSLKDMSDVIGEIRKQTSSISEALKSNSENSKQISDSVKKLSEKVDGQIELQKADIAALKADLKAVKVKPQVAAAPAKQKPKSGQVAAKPAPSQDKVAHVAVSRAAETKRPVNLPAAKAKPVAVRAPAPKPQAKKNTSGCAVTTVSENWRVKGVTPSSAYVERVQDGQGLLLRAGVSLPGFGTVRGFNPVERSVCTTSGIVRR